MNKRNPDPGYRLPAEIEPEGVVCIRAYVPDAPEYIAAFWGSYAYLTKWLAWERNDSKDAKIAAELWRQLFYRSRDEFECNDGECGIMDVRQREGSPCLLDKKTDCEDWEQFADMRLCVPRMRILNGVLQQDTTGSGDWVDAGDPEVPYDPRTDSYAPPPWENPPVGESGECLSAANVAEYVNFVASDACDWMVDGLSFFQALSGATAVLTALMDLIPLTLLTAFITALYAQVIDSWADARDFNITAKLRELMVCLYNPDGSMNQSQWEELKSNMADWRATLTDNDERAKWQIAIMLVDLWGNVGMTIAGQIWGITSAECDYNECAWTQEFDIATSQFGWSIFQGGAGAPAATWQSGTGFVGADSYDNAYSVMYIRSEFTPVQVDDVTFRGTGQYFTVTVGARLRCYLDNTLVYQNTIANVRLGSYDYVWHPGIECDKMEITFESHRTPPPDITCPFISITGGYPGNPFD